MRRKNSFRRRKSFMIDSNLAPPQRNKRVRNAFLNIIRKVFLWSVLTKWFKGQVFGSILLFGMASFVVFSLFSPYFKLKEISVVRNNPNIDVEVIQGDLTDFYGKNTLFLPKQDIEAVLKKSFPEFQSVKIKEKWPDAISIEIEISPSKFIMLNRHDATFFVLTNTGVLLPKNQDLELPVVDVLQYEQPFAARTLFLKPEAVQFIEEVHNFVETELKQQVSVTRYLWSANELHVVLDQDTALWFDLKIDLEDQMNRLLWALDEINFYSRPPVHVDLRIPSQLYWEPR